MEPKTIANKFKILEPTLNERLRRQFAAALAIGCG
jgi:hypothetical protein